MKALMFYCDNFRKTEIKPEYWELPKGWYEVLTLAQSSGRIPNDVTAHFCSLGCLEFYFGSKKGAP